MPQPTLNHTESPPLPAGWRWVQLGDVVQLNPRRPAGLVRDDATMTSFVPMDAVDQVTGVIAKCLLRPYGQVKKGYTYFAEGDVLFAKITPCMQNGKHAVARNLTDGLGFGTTEFHVLRPGPPVTSEWLHFFARRPKLLDQATQYLTGAVGQQRLPEDYLARLALPLPPLAEQQRIAARLDERLAAVEKARQAAEAQLAAVNALPSSLLRGFFPPLGSPLPAGWRRATLGEVSQTFSGGTPAKANAEFWQGSIPWVSAKDLKTRTLSDATDHISPLALKQSAARLAPADAVLVLVRGMGLAKGLPVCLLLRPCAFNQDIRAYVPNETTAGAFLAWSLRAAAGAILARRDTVTHGTLKLDADLLAKWPISLPPLPEQRRIAALLDEQLAAVDQARQAAEAQLAAVNALPAALLRQAFRGEW